MALVIKDRVQETTTTTGTGTLTLSGALIGYSSFSVIGNANTTYYCIFDSATGAWEAGIGTYTASGTTLSRDTVYANSLGTTALINFGAGQKFVFGGMPANKTVYLDSTGNVSPLGTVASGTWQGTAVGVAYGGTGLTSTPTNGQIDIGNGTDFTRATLTQGTGITITNGSGSISVANAGVTSMAGTSPVSASASTGAVTMSLASGYGDTQNPYASKTANYFLAAPDGVAGVPTFRAMVAADVPTLNQNTTGSAGSVANALTMNNSGTGAASGTTYNGSAAQTISYNTVGASPLAGSSSLTTTGTVTSGTWSASFGAVSGANLTSLTAGNLTGTIPSGVLGNSTVYIGTTAIALNRASASQSLTGVNIDGSAGSATSATNATNVAVTDDVATATSVYPVWVGATSGNTGVKLSSTKLTMVPSTGTVTSAGSFVANSDEKLKANWRPVQDDFVTKLAGIKSGVYDRVDVDLTQAGVSAQSWQKLLPETVQRGDDGILSVAYGNAALVAAVELAKEVVALRQEIAELKAKIGG